MNLLYFIRARLRWYRDKCPICKRWVKSPFAYYVTGHEKCFCRRHNQADTEMWKEFVEYEKQRLRGSGTRAGV